MRLGRVINVRVVAVRVRAAREADEGAVVCGARRAIEVDGEMSPILVEVISVGEAVARDARIVLFLRAEVANMRVRPQHLKVQRRYFVEAEATVEAADVVAAVGKVVCGR